jgi:hypothetical protein
MYESVRRLMVGVLMACGRIAFYRAKQSLGKEDSSERMKPFERIQLVKVQSG